MKIKSSKNYLLSQAKNVLLKDARAIEEVANKLDDDFISALKIIINVKGKNIFCGMGKSGLVAKKIAASLSSVGISSIFLHPAEAVHGDLGIISPIDNLIFFSNSGDTDEIKKIIPVVKIIGCKIISFVGVKKSYLAKESNLAIDIGIKKEADPYNLIPTASTTTALAIGDALLVGAVYLKNIKEENFAFLHPGGSAGRRFLKVKDLMHSGAENPVLNDNSFFKDALVFISSKKLGAVSLVNEKNKLTGILTDGDIRRLLVKTHDSLPQLFLTNVKELMTVNPKFVFDNDLASAAVRKMEEIAITVLPVLNNKKEPVGMLHIHTLVQAGFALEKKE